MIRKAFVTRTRSILVCFSILFFSLYSSLKAEQQAVPGKRATVPTVFVDSASSSKWSDLVVHQENISECACGPCAIFDSFQFGDATLTNMAANLPGATSADKVRSLISMYGGSPSSVARDEPRYLNNGGMWDEDIAGFINDWLKDNGYRHRVRGDRLVLKRGETPQEQVKRVYRELSRSLAAGFPPVVNLQSYAANGSSSHYSWNWLDGHFVAVVGVQDMPPDDNGFSMWVADSQSGRILQVSVSAGSTPFRAITDKRFRNGKEIDRWSNGYPYLTIRSPKLEGILEGDAALSHPQIVCVLQYIAHR